MRERAGFTLIELIIVCAIFGLIMVAAYETLDMTLRVEEQIDESTRAGKIGQAILMQIRHDLQSAAWHEQGRKIFLGVDHGDGDEAEDAMHFITFAPVPAPPDGLQADFTRDVASVGFVLDRADDAYVLFRRVKWNLDEEPLDGGHYFPIYERVKGLSLRYFDGREWFAEWDSQARIPEEVEEDPADPEDPAPAGGNPQNPAAPAGAAQPTESDDEVEEEEVLPLPVAVEVTLNIYLADERGMVKDSKGHPVAETHSMVIPLPCMDRLNLEEPAGTTGTSGTGN